MATPTLPLDRAIAAKILANPDGAARGKKRYQVILEVFWSAFPAKAQKCL